MKKLKIILTLLWAIANYSQELPQVIPPSPEAQAFEKYGNIPVSTYTGVPNINIPLYTIQQGDISVPISLSYHAGGVKVDEEASTVGLGWVLNAGGIISRNIYGDDDFANNYNFNSGGEGKAYLDSSVDDIIMNYIASDQLIYGSSVSNNIFDPNCTVNVNGVDLKNELGFTLGYGFQPDHFSFNIQGNTGKFILSRSGKAILEKQQKIDIQHYIDDYQDDGFELRTADGMIYTFKEGGRTIQTIDQNPSGGASSWLVEKITSPSTGKEVNFEYADYDPNTLIQSNYRVSLTDGEFSTQNPDFSIAGVPATCSASSKKENFISSTYEEKYLEYIDFDNGRVIFQYESGRQDLKNAKLLRSVKVYKKNSIGNISGSPIKEFQFEYEYFDSVEGYNTVMDNPSIDFNNYTAIQKGYINKRLKLKKVYEVGKPGYIFSYYNEYNSNIFKGKGTYSKDHWGYLNSGSSSLIPAFKGIIPLSGNNNIVSLPGGNREPDPTKTSIFSLKDIQYPTGGKTEFLYEPHSYDYSASVFNNNAIYRDLNILNDPTESTKTQTHNHNPDFGDAVQKETTFTIPNGNGNTIVEFSVLLECSGSNNQCDSLFLPPGTVYLETPDGIRLDYEVLCSNGTQDVTQPCQFEGSFTVGSGIHTIKTHINSGLVRDISVFLNWVENTPPPAITYGGGQRIKEIRDYDGINITPKNIKTFDYHYNENDVEKTHGLLMAKPLYELNRYSGDNFCIEFLRTSDSQVSLTGSPIAYNEVSVYTGANGELGHSTFHYRNQPDMVIQYNGYRKYYPALSFNSNGLLEKQMDHNANGDKVREVINTYTPETSSIQPESSLYMGIFKNYISNYTGAVDPQYEACYAYYDLYPSLKTNWIKLESSKEEIFDLGSTTESMVTTTDYEYGPTHRQLIKTTTTDSKGDILVQENKYAEDLNQTHLIANHMHSQVLFQQQTINDTILSTQLTEYSFSGLPLPNTMKTAKGENTMEDRVVFHGYDNQGNPLEVSRANGSHIYYVWGYNKEYPIAKIDNLESSQISTALQDLITAAETASDLDTDNCWNSTCKEQLLREALDDIRNHSLLSNSMVTTYTYDPLVGVTSITDPRGYTMYYEYDSFNHLKAVKDADRNLVSDYQYHYKNQQ